MSGGRAGARSVKRRTDGAVGAAAVAAARGPAGRAGGGSRGRAGLFAERKAEVAEVAQRFGVSIGCESRAGHAAKVIVNFAKEGDYDLIVIGHSDHSELWGRLLGDTADRISDHAHCSVLIVKQPEQPGQ